jgi:MoxR-like ATPase
MYFQQLVRNIPVTDHVLEYAVKLVAKTRPQRRNGHAAS